MMDSQSLVHPSKEMRRPLGHFDLQLVFFQCSAVELGDDSLRVFRGNIHEKMTFAEVNTSDSGRRESRASQNGCDNIIGSDTHGFANIHV